MFITYRFWIWFGTIRSPDGDVSAREMGVSVCLEINSLCIADLTRLCSEYICAWCVFLVASAPTWKCLEEVRVSRGLRGRTTNDLLRLHKSNHNLGGKVYSLLMYLYCNWLYVYISIFHLIKTKIYF